MKIRFTKEQLPEIVAKVVESSQSKVFSFHGQMGVGKTTLIKNVVKQLGGMDDGNSPTFGLVNEYHDTKGELLAYHFDFYRLDSEEEAYDLGLEDYFSSGAYIFIEWPEKVKNLLPLEKQEVFLQFIDENTRSIEF